MCSFQTLFHDNNSGYVVRCAECENIQVGYSNLMLTFNMGDFASFRQWLKNIKAMQDPAVNRALRCIVIPTPCEGMKLLMSMQELEEFDTMLEIADSELQSLAMIKLFDTH